MASIPPNSSGWAVVERGRVNEPRSMALIPAVLDWRPGIRWSRRCWSPRRSRSSRSGRPPCPGRRVGASGSPAGRAPGCRPRPGPPAPPTPRVRSSPGRPEDLLVRAVAGRVREVRHSTATASRHIATRGGLVPCGGTDTAAEPGREVPEQSEQGEDVGRGADTAERGQGEVRRGRRRPAPDSR